MNEGFEKCNVLLDVAIDIMKNMEAKELSKEMLLAYLEIAGEKLSEVKLSLIEIRKNLNEVYPSFDNVSILEMSKHFGRSGIRFENRCRANEIYTIGQLVKFGKKNFRILNMTQSVTKSARSLKNITVWKIGKESFIQ